MSKTQQSDFINDLTDRVAMNWPVHDWANSTVMVAVSGGADSVGLLRLLLLIRENRKNESEFNGEIIVGHCNHATRDACQRESDFVKTLASEVGVRYKIVARKAEHDRRDEKEFNHEFENADLNCPSEDDLREFRYRSLLHSAQSEGARYLVTGHHFDDQFETVLFRFLRGTGWSGLKGIPRVRVENGVSIVRPLLNIRRREIREFLDCIGQPFCEDESNDDDQYARNFLRNQVVPHLQHRFGEQIYGSVARLVEMAEENCDFMEQIALPFLDELTIGGKYVADLDVSELGKQHSVLIRQVAKTVWRRLELPEREMTREKWEMIARFISKSDDGYLQMPGNVTLVRAGDCVAFARTDKVAPPRKRTL